MSTADISLATMAGDTHIYQSNLECNLSNNYAQKRSINVIMIKWYTPTVIWKPSVFIVKFGKLQPTISWKIFSILARSETILLTFLDGEKITSALLCFPVLILGEGRIIVITIERYIRFCVSPLHVGCGDLLERVKWMSRSVYGRN